jgi:hypothetical protein
MPNIPLLYIYIYIYINSKFLVMICLFYLDIRFMLNFIDYWLGDVLSNNVTQVQLTHPILLS